MNVPGKEPIDPVLFWDVVRERDDYRSRVNYATHRIEDESLTQRDATGNVTAVVLPIDAWRSIRAILQREHVRQPPVEEVVATTPSGQQP